MAEPTEQIGESRTEEKKKFILVVEDDPGFRRLLCKVLVRQGFHVREAENGLVAKTIFDLAGSDLLLVISDIKMPEFDGVQLLQYMRKASSVPFVVMTGFSEILDAQEAFKMGASDFVSKPFRSENLLEVIKKCLDPAPPEAAKEEAAEAPSPQFCAVHIDDFICASRLVSDLYIKLAESKFIRVAHKGDAIPIERLTTYKEKKVEYLYVSHDDFSNYVGFNFQVATVAAKSTVLSNEKKMRLLKQSSEIMVEQCFLTGLQQEMIAPARQVIENTIDLVTQDPDVLQLFSNLESNGNHSYAHSVCVSVFACLAARQHGWVSSATQFKIALAGLLHDIGKKEIDRAILTKKRFALTKDEIKQIESHPIRGKEIVSQIKSLPDDIAIIILQHHENHAGTGYPAQTSGVNVHPLAKLIGTVDKVVGHILPSESDDSRMSPEAAIQRVLTFSKDEVDLTFLRRLMEVFRLDADEILSKAS